MKRKIYSETAYFMGLLILAFGTALMEKADMGMSMVVAPAYLIHLEISQFLPWFTFGVAEYTFQAFLLVVMVSLLRQFRMSFLFSFATAVIYGIMLDLVMIPTGLLPIALPYRLLYYLLGMLLCSLGVSLLFHTYIAPEVYELFVKEWSAKYNTQISTTKTVYDCISCAVSIMLSFLFFGFGHFEGVKLGTIICALCNGWIIGRITSMLDRFFIFPDRFKK